MSNSEQPDDPSKSRRTRARILDVAWDLLAERGLDVSMNDIAEAAGRTRQSLYQHFKSRGSLLMALVRRADERADIRSRFRDALAQPDPAGRLDAFLTTWLDFVPVIHPVASQLLRSRGRDAEAYAAWNDRMEELLDAFRQLTRGLRASGALADHWTAPRAAEFLWAGSSVQQWELLAIDCGWGPAQASKTLRRTLAAAVLHPAARA